MKKEFVFFLLLTHFIIKSQCALTLSINKSKRHEDKTGRFTPLVVSLSSEDKAEKVKGIDLIVIVDRSSSMSGEPIMLVKESLKYIVELMNEKDNFALVTFSSYSNIIDGLTPMTSTNKNKILLDINNLIAGGGTNIYAGLETGLQLLTSDYSTGERIAAMILLSDGWDNYGDVKTNFINLLNSNGKMDYTFSLHTFGYSNGHDADLLYELSKIKDGNYIFIERSEQVKEAYLKIYGSLSTVAYVNLELAVESKFPLNKVYGIDDMYQASKTENKFNTKLLQVIYGKRYDFVFLVDVPDSTPYGTEILSAKVSPLGLNKNYLWDKNNSTAAYEEYIRCIVFTIFIDGYNNGYTQVYIIEEGLIWIQTNYRGLRNWEYEFNIVITEFRTYYGEALKASILSRLRELTTSKVGTHYNDNINSYSVGIVEKSYNLDVSNLPVIVIQGEKIINIEININYYYFYLKEGRGQINNLYFSGEHTTFIFFSNNINDTIVIKSLTPSLEYYQITEKRTIFKSVVDFGRPGIFILKDNSPLEFYSHVDGTKDVTFNIELFLLELEKEETVKYSFEIYAYIVLESDLNYGSSISSRYTPISISRYNNELKMGKIVIKKRDIINYISSSSANYIYIVINNMNQTQVFNNIQGQFIFVPMDNIYSYIPENFSIYSNLEPGQTSPHLYYINMTFVIEIIVEFWTSGNKVDCKILNNKNYISDSSNIYNDFSGYSIKRTTENGKTIIKVISSYEYREDNIIISIFSKEDTTGYNESDLSYILKYTATPGNFTIVQSKKVLLLGFAKYIYIKQIRIVSFFIYLASPKKIGYVRKYTFTTKVIYKKKALRSLDDNEKIAKVECDLLGEEDNEQGKYNCTFPTNGEDIDNIELNDDLVNNTNLTIAKSSLADKYTNKLQEVGDKDLFDGKNNYILDNSTISIDADKREFDILGDLDKENFNHNSLKLNVSLKSSENQTEKEISCNVIKNSDNTTKLNCKVDTEELDTNLDGAYSLMEKDNLFISLKNGENGNIQFEKKINDSNNTDTNITNTDNNTDNTDTNNNNEGRKYYRKSNSGLSTGAIIGITIASVAVAAAIAITLALCLRKRTVSPITANSTVVANMNSSGYKV